MDIIIFISGYGSNLKAIIEYVNHHHLPINIVCVVSDNPHAYGLIIAEQFGIKTCVIPFQKDPKIYTQNLIEVIDCLTPRLIVLAGFMRILPSPFVQYFENKIINIHPSLLPKYPGLNTHKKVLAHQDTEHGCTIHIVNENLDAGPILAQRKFTVSPCDNEQTLQDKVHLLEHQLYPLTIARYLELVPTE